MSKEYDKVASVELGTPAATSAHSHGGRSHDDLRAVSGESLHSHGTHPQHSMIGRFFSRESNMEHHTLNHLTIARSGSLAEFSKDEHGGLHAIRRQSTEDLGALNHAVTKRLASSSQPNLLNVFGIQASRSELSGAPAMSAEDTLDRTKGMGDFYEHLWNLDSVADKYHTQINVGDPAQSKGLTSEQAAKFYEEYGPNVITPPPRIPLWLLFLLQFTNLLMILLMLTGTLCLILYGVDPSDRSNLYIGVILWIVVILTCQQTFSQEAQSDALAEQFRALVPQEASVIRDGTIQSIGAITIVPGDIIRIKSGDKVPADCRIIFSQSLKVDQANLTGESDAIEVSVDSKSPNPLESRNLVFNGSLVVDGTAFCVAIRTGDGTLIGKMVDLTGDVETKESTMQADIVSFIRILAVLALIQAVVVFVVGVARGLNPVDVFVSGFVVIMIGNVPQGLPTTITACLFIVADRMSRQNVFVKKLDVIETLGSCTCICTDKTGTLTQNIMTVANAWYMNFKFASADFVATARDSSGPQLKALLDVAALNSRVVLEKPAAGEETKENSDGDELVPAGDATELGLYRFCGDAVKARYNMDQEAYRAANPKVHEIPFNSENKWQMSIHKMQGDDKEMLLLKGGPDVVLKKCSRYMNADGSIVPMDEHFDKVFQEVYESFGGNGERVLGFAMLPLERTVAQEEASNPDWKGALKERLVGKPPCPDPITNLIFTGLITLRDPPREEVPKAIADCHRAGVKVVMVTGDHPLTAEAISRQIGLITKPTRLTLSRERGVPESEIAKDDPEIGAVVIKGVEISGSELENIPPMTEEDWTRVVNTKEIVFARTSPENKLTIVKEFTKAGNITAMTGDGVNDSPALKQAAIGVAMGKNGSDVAREAADIVLLDDNFASIVIGVKEGRLLFANLKKSIAYSLAHLTPEVVPVLLWSFVGIPQPQGALLTLCIDLLTELLPSTALAYEEPESMIMQVPPRDTKVDKLASYRLLFYAYGQAGIIITGAALLVYFRTFETYGLTPKDLFDNNNRYFPSEDGDAYVTSDGRVYDESEQKDILKKIQGSWYLMIVCGQAAHIWVTRTAVVSIFKHGIFNNYMVDLGVVVALCLACFVVYTPGLQDVVGAAPPNQLEIFYGSLLAAGVLWSWAEGRKWFTRNYPEHPANKYLAW
jgi:sodium/potassium-transporting ATPase subunit alpha